MTASVQPDASTEAHDAAVDVGADALLASIAEPGMPPPGPATRLMARRYAEIALTAAWPIIAAAEREQVAQAIETTFACWERGEVDRPRYERGGFFNDRDWCIAIARAGTSGGAV